MADVEQKAIITVSPFDLPANSVAAAMLATWKLAGGTYKDLFLRSLMYYSATGEFRRGLRELGDEKAAKAWLHKEA
jgi:hypothetical protein